MKRDVNAIRHEFCTPKTGCVVTNEKGPAGLCPVDRPLDDPSLEGIRQALAAQVENRKRLHEAVAHSRKIGRTWGEIAVILRCSRQAARERFGQ